ncbi:hypothetical protein AVEN_61105-1 [Araneus ventricosus]|uniref:Uncharacterized protein n=1 Tax=Araneus ventricosus TaxID=182803 RepID=A0A4Y2QA70_ARAVE|nr:hypothetical protein AVEN_61105-1 [Araneus ventricosus]
METFVTTLYPCRRQGCQNLLDELSLLSGILVPRLGWKKSLFPHVNNGKSDVSQPNRGYQNRLLVNRDGGSANCDIRDELVYGGDLLSGRSRVKTLFLPVGLW